MRDHAELGRLMEARIAGELQDAEADAAIDAALSDPDAAEAADLWRFEKTLERVLDVPPFNDDLADQVLDRINRRTSMQLTRPLADGLAGRVLDDAMRSGRIVERPVRSKLRLPRPMQLARIAALALVCWAMWVWFSRDIRTFLGTAGDGASSGDRVAQVLPIAQVYFGAADAIDALGDGTTKERMDALGDGDVVATRAGEAALISVPSSGRVTVQPMTRVVVTKGPRPGSIRVQLIEGRMRVSSGRGRSIFVASASGAEGEVAGDAEVGTIAAEPLFGASPEVAGSLLVCTNERKGSSVAWTRPAVSVDVGEIGLVGDDAAFKLPSTAAPGYAGIEWNGGGDVVNGEVPLLAIDEDFVATRGQIAGVLMHTFAAELADMILRNAVTAIEARERKIEITPEQLREAADAVAAEPFYRFQPLGSREARSDRARQVAVLLALARRDERAGDRVHLVLETERQWQRLAATARIEMRPADSEMVFRLSHRGRTVDVTRAQAWNDLQRYLRAAEVDAVVRDLCRSHLVRRLYTRLGMELKDVSNEDALDPMRRAGLAVAVRMQGLSWRQFWNRRHLGAAMARLITPASHTDLDAWIKSNPGELRQVAVEHFVFPYAEPDQGLPIFDTPAAMAAARDRADALIRAHAAGSAIPVMTDLDEARRFVETGPRSHWRDSYGDTFTAAVVNLSEGVISDPIRGPEGWHVARILKVVELDRSQQGFLDLARAAFIAAAVSRRMDELLHAAALRLPSAAEILQR